jgi:hypothetical protein
MKRAEKTIEQDELLARLSMDMVELIDTTIVAMSPTTQEVISEAVRAGGQIAILVRMVPWPEFRGLLFTGPDNTPVELFVCSPSALALRPQPQETGH